jgi:integrase/recombinase XerD
MDPLSKLIILNDGGYSQMIKNDPSCFSKAIKQFFTEHLLSVRGLSKNTIESYRDTFCLLFRFVMREKHKSSFNLEDFTPEIIIMFLAHLEEERFNKATTRNVRLAAIHSFFRYLPTRYPEYIDISQRILSIQSKKVPINSIEYLEKDEISTIINSINKNTPEGRRDFALITVMFNTGGRIQEILDLRPCDIILSPLIQVRFLGKGQKERFCPLWPSTSKLLIDLIAELKLSWHSQEPIFLNRRGNKLTRFGARYIIKKYSDCASQKMPSISRKKPHPHTFRHSTAVHLLKSGVDIVTISHWLGHSNIETTNHYTTIDLETKRLALENIQLDNVGSFHNAKWQKNESLLSWLEKL